MNYEQLKEEVRQISEIASSVPEQFRDRCFELLLTNLIDRQSHAGTNAKSRLPKVNEEPEGKAERDPAATLQTGVVSSDLPITTQLRLFMRKTSVTKEEVGKILMYDGEGGGDVHFVKEPHEVGVTTGQIEWALLLALKNAILKDSLSVDPEDVRSVCQEKGFYDSGNFAGTFKKPNNSKLFKGLMVAQGEAQQLTSEGQDALGKLIKRLGEDSQ